MSRLKGFIDPETRCYVETVTAAARPGRHRPDATVTQTADERSGAQRCHDGIKLGLQAGIASGARGTHRGHPVTVIVRTTLAELNQAAHAATNPDIPMPSPARTGGHSALPMRDVIRMGADAIHYLAVFEDHTQRPIYLGRQTRIASTDQRILCYAATAAAPGRAVKHRAITAKCTTAPTGRPAVPPMPTARSSPAPPITSSSPTGTTKPKSPTPPA
jgi:hypothetical protein